MSWSPGRRLRSQYSQVPLNLPFPKLPHRSKHTSVSFEEAIQESPWQEAQRANFPLLKPPPRRSTSSSTTSSSSSTRRALLRCRCFAVLSWLGAWACASFLSSSLLCSRASKQGTNFEVWRHDRMRAGPPPVQTLQQQGLHEEDRLPEHIL